MRNVMQMRNSCRKGKTTIWLIIEIVSLGMIIICAGVLVYNLIYQQARQKEEATSTSILEAIAEPETTAINNALGNITINDNPPMFEKAKELYRKNPDLVGMVGFGKIALYVCQSDDNIYYASHRFDRAEDPAGMIYMDCRCEPWPMGDNTILYGHNMRDGSRFGMLNRFTDPEFLIEHPYVQYASLYEIHEYQPIAVMYISVSPEHKDYFPFDQYRFDTEEEFNSYIDTVRELSILDLPSRDVRYGAHLLTLATCSEEYDGGRLVVVCVQRR